MIISKRIYSVGTFKVNPDPNDWTAVNIEFMTRSIYRKSKRRRVLSVDYIGCFGDESPYLKFHINVGGEKRPLSRKGTLEDIRLQLLMESI